MKDGKSSMKNLREIWETQGWTEEFTHQLRSFIVYVIKKHGGKIDEDLIQDSLLKVWLALHDYDPRKGSFESFIYTLVRNQVAAAAYRQKAQRERVVDEFFEHDHVYEPDPTGPLGMATVIMDLSPDVQYRAQLLEQVGSLPCHWLMSIERQAEEGTKQFIKIMRELTGEDTTAQVLFLLSGWQIKFPSCGEMTFASLRLLIDQYREADEEFNAALASKNLSHPAVKRFIDKLVSLGLDGRTVRGMLKKIKIK